MERTYELHKPKNVQSKKRKRDSDSFSSIEQTNSTAFKPDRIEMDQIRVDGISETTSVRDEISMGVNGLSTKKRDVVMVMFKKLFVCEMSSFSFCFKAKDKSGTCFFSSKSSPVQVLSKAPTLAVASKSKKRISISFYFMNAIL